MEYLSSVTGWIWPSAQPAESPVDTAVFDAETVPGDWVLIQDCVSGKPSGEASPSLRSPTLSPSKCAARELIVSDADVGPSAQASAAMHEPASPAVSAQSAVSVPPPPAFGRELVAHTRSVKAERHARDSASRARGRRSHGGSMRANHHAHPSGSSSIGSRHKGNPKFFGGHAHQPRRDIGFAGKSS
eukprot:Opistho-1_new@88539